MKAKVQKWGNSLGVRIPKEIAIKADFDDGSQIEITAQEGVVTIKAVSKKVTLAQIIKQLKTFDKESEIEWGEKVGMEVW